MSRPGGELPGQPRFLADRMLGTLCRYLRFMGYDTVSATEMAEGNTREDTILLARARAEGRILLTRDRELARRGDTMLSSSRRGASWTSCTPLPGQGLSSRRSG